MTNRECRAARAKVLEPSREPPVDCRDSLRRNLAGGARPHVEELALHLDRFRSDAPVAPLSTDVVTDGPECRGGSANGVGPCGPPAGRQPALLMLVQELPHLVVFRVAGLAR